MEHVSTYVPTSQSSHTPLLFSCPIFSDFGKQICQIDAMGGETNQLETDAKYVYEVLRAFKLGTGTEFAHFFNRSVCSVACV